MPELLGSLKMFHFFIEKVEESYELVSFPLVRAETVRKWEAAGLLNGLSGVGAENVVKLYQAQGIWVIDEH